MTAQRVVRGLGALFGTFAGFEYAVYIISQTHPAGLQQIWLIGLCVVAGAIFGGFGLPYVTIKPFQWVDTQLKETPLPQLVGGVIGLLVGLLLAALAAVFLRGLPYGLNLVASGALALLFGYWGVILGLNRHDELFALFRGGAGAPTMKIILDTSVVIDGRLLDIAKTGFLNSTLVAPHFVLAELQMVADSSEPVRRQRGRRGLDILDELKRVPDLSIDFTDHAFTEIPDVDHRLIKLAREMRACILTTDYNLNKVAQLEGVKVLNINDLANSLKPVMVPGEEMTVTPIKEGKEPNQGVAYLPDGTMVVVEGGRARLGQTIRVSVTSVIQTAAGRMIFTAAHPVSEPAHPAAAGD